MLLNIQQQVIRFKLYKVKCNFAHMKRYTKAFFVTIETGCWVIKEREIWLKRIQEDDDDKKAPLFALFLYLLSDSLAVLLHVL